MNVRDEKIALRKEINAKLLAMDEALLTAGDSEIKKRLEALPEYAGSGEIFFYYGTGREISTAPGSKNKGIEIDATPWLGPIGITWDYENRVAPFFGMFGIPSEGRFISGKEMS